MPPALPAASTICPICGEPISSSPSATITRLTGIFFSAALIACNAARNAASGPFWFTAPRPMIAFAQRRFVHQPRFGRRRSPLRRIELFHVVHEIKADRFRRAGIERGEHARLSVSANDIRPLKSRFARQLRHIFRAFRITAVLRRDRHLMDPILEPLHRFIVLLRDLRLDLREIIRRSEC